MTRCEDCKPGSLLRNAFEKVGGLVCRLRLGCGGKGVVFLLAVLAEDGFGLDHQRRLRGVGGEGALLPVEDTAHVERDGPGCGRSHVATRQEEVGGDVEQALRRKEFAEAGVASGVRRPVEGCGGEGRDHGVVRVRIQRAVAAEGKDDVGLEAADAFNEERSGFGEVCVFELAVFVGEDFVVLDAEDLAGGGELGAAKLAEFFVGFCVAAVAACGAGGKADGGDFDTGVGGKGERSTKGEAFIIRMGEDAEKFHE